MKIKYHPKTREELVDLIDDLSINLGEIDTSAITDMMSLFYYPTSKRGTRQKELLKKGIRQDFTGIENWDVSNVEDMSFMFCGLENFNQPLNSWNVSKVKNMSAMFAKAKAFNQPLDSWDVSNVENMSMMFNHATAFNKSLDKWNVSGVENMSSMFSLADSFNQPLDSWDVGNVENMSSMFMGAHNFNQSLESWNVSKVENMSSIFEHANALQKLPSWYVEQDPLEFWEKSQKEFKDALREYDESKKE